MKTMEFFNEKEEITELIDMVLRAGNLSHEQALYLLEARKKVEKLAGLV
jgi:hypothetical protein